MGVDRSSRKRKIEPPSALDDEEPQTSSKKSRRTLPEGAGNEEKVATSLKGSQTKAKKKIPDISDATCPAVEEEGEKSKRTEGKRKSPVKSRTPDVAESEKKSAPLNKTITKEKNGSDRVEVDEEKKEEEEEEEEESQSPRKRRFLSFESASIKRELQVRVDRDKKCLVVKNLDPGTTEEDLKGASDDLIEVRVKVQKSKKAGGKKLAFLEFKDQKACQDNLEVVAAFVAKFQPEAVVKLGDKLENPQPMKNLVFDTHRLFIRGLKAGTRISEIESLFPSCLSIEGEFGEEDGDDKGLLKDSVTVEFSSVDECSKVKNSKLRFKGSEVCMEFAMANRRQTAKVLKKEQLRLIRDSLKKKKMPKKQGGKKKLASRTTKTDDLSSPSEGGEKAGHPSDNPPKRNAGKRSPKKSQTSTPSNGETSGRGAKKGTGMKPKQKNPKGKEDAPASGAGKIPRAAGGAGQKKITNNKKNQPDKKESLDKKPGQSLRSKKSQ